MLPATSASPEDFKKLIAEELKSWPDVVKDARITPE
jgi:tripartite-type tricarboxylate transporter receptor subunit TctC